MPSVWDNIPEDPPTEYIALNKIVDFGRFNFDHSYREQEVEILQPQMEAAGYKSIQWLEGERDCHGPLTRTCRALDRDNRVVWFVYG